MPQSILELIAKPDPGVRRNFFRQGLRASDTARNIHQLLIAPDSQVRIRNEQTVLSLIQIITLQGGRKRIHQLGSELKQLPVRHQARVLRIASQDRTDVHFIEDSGAGATLRGTLREAMKSPDRKPMRPIRLFKARLIRS